MHCNKKFAESEENNEENLLKLNKEGNLDLISKIEIIRDNFYLFDNFNKSKK